MTDEFSLDEAQSLANYVAWMDVVEKDLYDTASYVSNVVCGDEGYPLLMKPVVDALDEAAWFFRDMVDLFVERWNATEQTLFEIGRAYGQDDEAVSRLFDQSDLERRIEMQQKANQVRQEKIDREMGLS